MAIHETPVVALQPVLGKSQPQLHERFVGKVRWRFEELCMIADYLDIPLSKIIAAVEDAVEEADDDDVGSSRRTA